MDVLTTRTLSYPDDSRNEREVVLTVFKPFESKFPDWKCGFVFGPPIHRPNQTVTYSGGSDFIQAIVSCLIVARGYFEGTELFGRLHWRGMLDCGLPWPVKRGPSLSPADIPPLDSNAGSMDVLATRILSYPDESRGEKELLLTVFMPFKGGEGWKCGFTFGPPPNAPVRYGVGADFIEALLDGLASARATYDGEVPEGWESPSRELLSCDDFPYKIGRSFCTDPVGEPQPDKPDVSAG